MFVNAIALAFSLGDLQAGRGLLGKALLNIQLMSSYLILNIRLCVKTVSDMVVDELEEPIFVIL
jgi:hypothetical protein